MIRIVSVALSKSPTNLAQGDEIPQIITRITRQWPSENLRLLQNDFCNTISSIAEIPSNLRNKGGQDGMLTTELSTPLPFGIDESEKSPQCW